VWRSFYAMRIESAVRSAAEPAARVRAQVR
jgi:hypothetical protein